MKGQFLFSTGRYRYLRDLICMGNSFVPGRVERRRFPDGELYLRLEERVKGKDVCLIGGTGGDPETLELFDLACGLVYDGAISLSLIIPYFGYSTMERAIHRGEIIPAKNRALLLSAIPKARMGNEYIFFDLHTQGVPHYLEGNVTLAQLSARPIVNDILKELGPDVVLASTDAGRAKWIESMANDAGVDAAFVYKQRLSGSQTRITGVNACVENKTVVIYDDMIRTGGSMIQAGKAYLENGAESVIGLTTHGVFPDQALEKMQSSGFFQWIGCTNTHPRAIELEKKQDKSSGFLKVFDVSKVIREYLENDIA